MGDKAPTSIKELYKLMTDVHEVMKKEMNEANDSLKKELDDVVKSMKFMNTTFEELRGAKEELGALKREHEALKAEKEGLKQTLANARKEITEFKQYSRKNNIEIKGIPQLKDESLTEVVQKIGDKVGVRVQPSDIDVVHRVPTKERGSTNVIVRFVSRTARDNLVQAARKKRLTARQIGFEHEAPIYVNDHLCPEYKVLLGLAIAKKKEKNWKFVWVGQSKILARKAENANVVHIATTDDLAKIV